jgi:hypothetical protein
MIKQVLYYRVYCETESAYTYTWNSTTPTACPNDNTHTISTSTITVLDKIDQATFELKEESPVGEPTSGRYRCDGLEITVPANTVKPEDYSWPYPISVLTLRFNTDEAHRGDYVEGYVLITSQISNLTSALASGNNVLPVNSDDISNFEVGMEMVMSDYLHTQSLGKITSIDNVNYTITVQTQTVYNFEKNSRVSRYVPIGINTVTVNAGDTSITCNSTVPQVVFKGLYMCIADANNKEFLGEIISVDAITGVIETSIPPVNTYAPGSYIYMQIKVVKNYKLTAPMMHAVGDGKIGGSYIPANYVMRTVYTNNGNTEKNFAWYVELLY